mgnify:CR=1 FL=1
MIISSTVHIEQDIHYSVLRVHRMSDVEPTHFMLVSTRGRGMCSWGAPFGLCQRTGGPDVSAIFTDSGLPPHE